MRAWSIVVVALIMGACGKETPTPVSTSPDGNWTYTTPDKTIKVSFGLKSTSTTSVEVLHPMITVQNVEGEGAAQIDEVDLPSIGRLRINANDPKLVFNYDITFTTCSVSPDFDKIIVSDVLYTYAAGKVKTLTNVNIVREP